MKKNESLNLDYETETTENTLTFLGGTSLFMEFLGTIGFDKIGQTVFPEKKGQGYSALQYIMSIVLVNLTGGESTRT